MTARSITSLEAEIYCKFCFQDWLRDLVDNDPDMLADALNIMKICVFQYQHLQERTGCKVQGVGVVFPRGL